MKRTAKMSMQKEIACALFPALIFLSSCSDLFQSKIPMDTESSSGTLSGLFARNEVITELSAPSQVQATQGTSSSTIYVSWSAVTGATSYRIERATLSKTEASSADALESLDFSVLNEYYYGTSFKDTVLQNPHAQSTEYDNFYYYRIMAQNVSEGLESDFTDISTEKTAAKGYLLPPPQHVEAQKGESTTTIQISWQTVQGAASYSIYRSEDEGFSAYTQLSGSIIASQPFYTDSISSVNQGKELYYKVCAQSTTGELSALSTVAMGYTLQEGAPSCPATVTVENALAESISELKVSWSTVSPPGTGTLTYSLFRTSSADAAFTRIAKGLTTTAYTDKSVKPGLTYYYYVQSSFDKDDSGDILNSAFTKTGPTATSPALGFLLSPPATLEVGETDDANTALLTWAPALGTQEHNLAYTYTIYVADTESDAAYSILDGFSQTSGTQTESGLLNARVPKKNYYKIATVNAKGTQSALSTAAAPMPDAPEHVIASKTAAPKETEKPNSYGVYPVHLSWQCPSNDTPSGYLVYRSTKPNTAFRKLTESPITELQYTDTNDSAKAGTYYYYKIVSVNSLGQGKKSNDPATDTEHNAWGYGAVTPDQWFREYNKTVMNSQKKLTLMHKANDMDKLGSETISGAISGTLGYTAKVAGLGAEITMPYSNYADFYIQDNSELGVYFLLNGNTDTSSNMSGNGNMHGTVTCKGMYPGTADYGGLEIKGGAAGGGFYGVKLTDLGGNEILSGTVSWLIGEEGRK